MFNSSGRPAPWETTVEDLSRRLEAGEQIFLLDVREPEEYEEARIDGSALIPLGQLAMRAHEIPTDRPVVAICRSGQRSGVATEMLRRAGHPDVVNMRGGMIAWVRANLPYASGA